MTRILGEHVWLKVNFICLWTLKIIKSDIFFFKFEFFYIGDGEIIEEIVSSSRQKEINKAATQADAASFQSNLNDVLKNSWN